MKKLYIFTALIVIFFVMFLIIIFNPRDYSIVYYIDEYRVIEKFNRELEYHSFFIEHNDLTYPIIYSNINTNRRRLVSDIKKIYDDETICLLIQIKDKLHPVCYFNDELISFHLTSAEIRDNFEIVEFSNSVIDSFGSVQIYNYLGGLYFVWNYKGYYLLSEEYNRNIVLLDTDDYNNALAFKVNEFLITPNYDRNHNFNELFVINSNNLELRSFVFDNIEISYNSYFQGVVGRYAYIIDRRSRLQYRINIRRNNIELIGTENLGGRWYNNGWENESLIRMANEKHLFIHNKIYEFSLIEGNLYSIIGEFRKRISNQEVKSIIYVDNDKVYYLVENKLYMFSNATGEVRLMSNSEWHFNYQNKIFIFN